VGAGNAAAHAVYLRAGFHDVASLPDAMCHDGVYSATITMIRRLVM
jgi:RimJ/RimL family protein N-acetyltransferase